MRYNLKVRIGILTGLVGLIFGFFIFKLMQMQIVQGKDYLEQAMAGSVSKQTVKAARGEIVDRNGKPLAVNKIGFDIVFYKEYMPSEKENEVILSLVKVLNGTGEEWIDNLPISKTEPFEFLSGEENESKITRLKKDLRLNVYATVQNVIDAMVGIYEIDTEGLTPQEIRIIAGVRYEMAQMDYSIPNPYTFASNISTDTVARIKENNVSLPGVDISENPIREYVNWNLAPHVIGQIGPIYKEEYEELKEKGYQMNDSVGKSGIEQAFEEYLRGKDGEKEITLNSNGELIEVKETVAPVPGNTVQLTIDSDLQKVAQEALEKQINYLRNNEPLGQGGEADSGAAVAVDVKTGEILAMATYPSYDLETYKNDYEKLRTDKRSPLLNRAIQGLYAPGSCFKPVVATAGMMEQQVTASHTVFCGMIYRAAFEEYQPRCLGYHANINVINALRVSCNIYFYDTGFHLGIDTLNKYADGYGIGQSTGIELPEQTGYMASPETAEMLGQNWEGGDILQASIGQSYTMISPLQLTNYVATIANRGKRMESHIVKQITNYEQNQTIKKTEPVVAHEFKDTVGAYNAINEGMILASSSIGTSGATFGSYYANHGIQIASKTGTPETNSEAYQNSTYITYAPADKPEIAIAVVIEKGWHGYTGAPVAKDIYDYYFGFTKGESPEDSQ
ncbi:penicillin-binding transpeptidase domain-containing protein [Candidatus Soleaferrea massiliensis]|uniref:penicillin-binding transpeptidase domain-containing protein n=1 Tax=Candidatus Soleaferrea massiliensis TaxID=1470354 RepID=UPI0018CF65CA|nr:penicillin-binding transpeptidase domain-containing protein [Candidatus Soleaferrea massiliensis]